MYQKGVRKAHACSLAELLCDDLSLQDCCSATASAMTKHEHAHGCESTQQLRGSSDAGAEGHASNQSASLKEGAAATLAPGC